MAETLRLILAARRNLTPDICEFTFHGAGNHLPAFTAGSHLNVRTPAGAWRSYSLSNDDGDVDTYVIAVKREERGKGGSLSMHRDLEVGQIVEARPPHNAFPVKPAAKYLLIAGGIGITPILSMFRRLSRDGADVEMIYLTRSAELTAYYDLFQSRPFLGRAALHHDEGDPKRLVDLWPFIGQPDERHIYYCGPGPLMQAIYLQTIHWPRAQIHSENFAGVTNTDVASKAFTVRRARTDELFEVPADKSILDVLRTHRIDVESSCESGTCGTCRMRLVAGAADHRDMVLADAERATAIMPCVSRAAADEITLDF